ncbi:hypothetical protein ACU686_20355 [Yinghuangia aomiensis]
MPQFVFRVIVYDPLESIVIGGDGNDIADDVGVSCAHPAPFAGPVGASGAAGTVAVSDALGVAVAVGVARDGLAVGVAVGVAVFDEAASDESPSSFTAHRIPPATSAPTTTAAPTAKATLRFLPPGPCGAGGPGG